MIAQKYFSNVTTITRNATSYPISIADVKAYSDYFRTTVDTSQDAYIDKMIAQVVDGWEHETGFLLLDQTFKTSMYNAYLIHSAQPLGLTRLNVRSFGDILYYPNVWDQTGPMEILATDQYFWEPERGITPAIFILKDGIRCVELWYSNHNFETTITAGYALNNFTTMPTDIKNCLAMQAADIMDARQEDCSNKAFHMAEVRRVYRKYTAFTTMITT